MPCAQVPLSFLSLFLGHDFRVHGFRLRHGESEGVFSLDGGQARGGIQDFVPLLPFDGACCFASIRAGIQEVCFCADAGLGYSAVLETLEQGHAQHAVVARMSNSLKRRLGGLRYELLNPQWEIGECEHRVSERESARRCIVARRPIEETEPYPTLFTLARYAYRAWLTDLPLSPAGVWHFYDGRAGMEPRIGELREHFVLRKIPSRAFEANAL